MIETDSAPSVETVAVELSLAIGQLRRRLRNEADASEFNLSQMATLLRIEQQQWITTSELARAESMKPQSMGAILAGFEQNGLVERRPHPTDGRQVQFALTPKGNEARTKRSMVKREWLLAAIARLDPTDRKILIDAIALIKRLGDT